MNLTEAFKVLDSLTEDTFDLDQAGIAKLSDFENDDFQDDAVQVIDVEATTEDELKDSYVGKVILDCQVCHSKHYADKENIVLDETETLANVGEECPYCYTVDGFKIIGEIKPFETEGVESEVEVEAEVEDEVEDEVEEGLLAGDINLNLDARGFGGKDNNVSVLGGKLPIKESKPTKNEGIGADDEVIIGLYGDEVRGFDSVDQLAQHFEDNGIAVISKSGDMEYGWDLEIKGNARDIYRLVNDKITGYNCNSTQEFVDRYRIDESKSIKESVEGDIYSAVGKHFNYSVNSEFADLITDLVDRALSEEGDDISDNIMTAIDEGLIYNKDIWTVKEFYEESALSDGTFENLFNDMHSIISSIKDDEDLEEKCLNEDIKDISITTDDTHMSMYTEDGGKVVITSEPIEGESCEECEEVIEPISDETKAEIEIENEVEGEDDMIDFEIDEFDEESFDELGERYLKKVYENVNSFKCTNVSTKKDKLIVEGKVNFASGKVSPTKFVFEACNATEAGQVSFVGHNKNITRGNKAFTLNGIIKDKNLIAESFKYNYMARNPEGKSSRIYGTIKKI